MVRLDALDEFVSPLSERADEGHDAECALDSSQRSVRDILEEGRAQEVEEQEETPALKLLLLSFAEAVGCHGEPIRARMSRSHAPARVFVANVQ